MVLMNATDRAAIDNIVTQVQKESMNQGFSISITTQDGKGDYEKAYGLGNRRPAVPLTLADSMRIGSTSKTFVAKGILREVDRGSLTLDSKLSQYISGVPRGDQITIRDMLTMRSGVWDYQSDMWTKIKFAFNHVSGFTEAADQISIIRGKDTGTLPNTKFEYTNSNFVLLGEVLGAVTGRNWRDIVQKDMLNPLGMTHTVIPGHQNWMMPEPWAHGFGVHLWLGMFIKDEDQSAWNPDLFGAAGELISTVGDLQIWGQALRDGFLLSPEMHQLQETFFHMEPYTLEGPTQFGYGLGSFKLGEWLGHDGSVPGYTANCMYHPTNGCVIAGLENYQSPNVDLFSKVFRRIAKYLYPSTMP